MSLVYVRVSCMYVCVCVCVWNISLCVKVLFWEIYNLLKAEAYN